MFRTLASKLTISIIILFSITGKVMANPTITYISPFIAGDGSYKIGQPLSISVVFSESVYGFNVNDIASNGQVLTVDGSNRNYRIVVVPRQRILTLEILADGAKGVSGEGNDPLIGGPFIFDTSKDKVLSYHHDRPSYTSQNFIPPAAYGPLQYSQPSFLPDFQYKKDIVAIQQQSSVARTVEKNVAKKPRRTSFVLNSRTRFILNLGIPPDASDFINHDTQTPAKPGTSQELNLGFETISPFRNRPDLGLGFYLTSGYYKTPYAGAITVAGTRRQTNAEYTAIPLEIGAGFHIQKFMTISAGLLTHINGKYSHSGYFLPETGGAREDTKFTANLENGSLGAVINLTFRYQHVGFSIKYTLIPLRNFTQTTRNLGQPDSIEYQTINFIRGVGFYLSFNS